MSAFITALLIGAFAGLRTFTPPAAVAWAAYFGKLHLANSPLSFLAHPAAAILLTVAALGELYVDKLPSCPSRKAPPGFAGRIVSGGLCGAALGVGLGSLTGGMMAGMVGAMVGTLGGYEGRRALAGSFDRDTPAALIEDLVAIAGSVLVVGLLKTS